MCLCVLHNSRSKLNPKYLDGSPPHICLVELERHAKSSTNSWRPRMLRPLVWRHNSETVQVKKGPVFLNQLCRQLRFALVKAKQEIALSPETDHLSYQSSAGHSFLAAFYFDGDWEAFHKSLLLYRWKLSSTTPESSKVRTCVLCTTVNVILPFSAACNPRFHLSLYNIHLHH